MSLSVSNLAVDFSGFHLGPVDVELPEAGMLALIGTNGSGKSTLIRSVLGLQSVASGSVEWRGRSVRERDLDVISDIGYVSDSNKDLLAEFTPLEYWNYSILAFERAKGRRCPEILERAVYYSTLLDFPFERKVPLAGLSLGTARKAQLIAAFMNDPGLLILDEPFIGLDFLSSRALEKVLVELRNNGTAIAVSNHDLDLAARLADQILVLHRGQVLLNTTVESLGGHAQLEHAVSESLRTARETAAHATTTS